MTKYGDLSFHPSKVKCAFLADLDHLAPNDLEGHGQSTPFSIGFWKVPRYTFGANLVILAKKTD